MKLQQRIIDKATRIIPDKLYISLIYRIRMKKRMNWRNPTSFTEKLQWLKLHNRNPEYIKLVDKYEMKQYVKEKLGEGYTVPTLGLWESVEDIDFSALPAKFVLKCTHDSGSNILCKNKDELDIEKTKKFLHSQLKSNLYDRSREWPYKNVKPRIIAEQLLETKEAFLTEYKIFCFDGVPKMTLVCKGIAHTENRTNDFCNTELERFPFTQLLKNSTDELVKPECYEELLQCAAKLSAGLPVVRVDAYVTENKIYFGELTFFHNSGLRRFEPDEWDYKIGEWIKLPEEEK